uniref:RNase H type-1 domain-containing protein n=1 Tax=Aegilops tauschii TaxID=37682 RepID=R7WCZ3_AEGTA
MTKFAHKLHFFSICKHKHIIIGFQKKKKKSKNAYKQKKRKHNRQPEIGFSPIEIDWPKSAREYLPDLEISLPIHPSQVVRQAPGHARTWIPAPLGSCKINVEAAIWTNIQTGAIGVVCHNDVGSYVGSSTLVFHGPTDPTTLEPLAYRESLVLAKDLMLQRIRVASDSKMVVSDINTNTLGVIAPTVKEINETERIFKSALSFMKAAS